jgi:hypothetical protein
VPKTQLNRMVGDASILNCHLDSDAIAVHSDVYSIFDRDCTPVALARDYVDLATFSRHAVVCEWTDGKCSYLADTIRKAFEVQISDPTWRLWDPGCSFLRCRHTAARLLAPIDYEYFRRSLLVDA